MRELLLTFDFRACIYFIGSGLGLSVGRSVEYYPLRFAIPQTNTLASNFYYYLSTHIYINYLSPWSSSALQKYLDVEYATADDE